MTVFEYAVVAAAVAGASLYVVRKFSGMFREKACGRGDCGCEGRREEAGRR